VKQLCADSIPQFIHFFPALSDAALNVLIDLCESEKLLIRLHAVKGLELLCVNVPTFTIRVVEVLLQLATGSGEPREIAAVKSTLTTLFTRDLTSCFTALFSQIKELEEMRSKMVEYGLEQLIKYRKQIEKDEILAKEIIASGLKSTLNLENGIEPKEMKQLLSYLLKMKVMKGDESFNLQLGTILSHQAKLNQDFNPTNSESVQQFITALQQVGFYKKVKTIKQNEQNEIQIRRYFASTTKTNAFCSIVIWNFGRSIPLVLFSLSAFVRFLFLSLSLSLSLSLFLSLFLSLSLSLCPIEFTCLT